VAGDWIKMRSNLWDDPRVSKLCDLLDCGEAQIVGALYWLWATADQHTEDGILAGLSLKQIDRKTGVQGFAQALCDIGWLSAQPDGVRVTRFEEHNGTTAKKRAVTAKRVANHRSNADVTQPALQDDDASVTGALAREREEKEKSSVPKGTGGEAAKSEEEMTKTELWRAGKSLLAEQGMPKDQCGSFVGKLVTDYGDKVVVEAVRTAVVKRPADVAEYLVACCQKSAGKRGPAQAGRQHDTPEETAKKMAENRKGTAPPPIAIKEQLSALTRKLTGKEPA
jgi:hypothetical protein